MLPSRCRRDLLAALLLLVQALLPGLHGLQHRGGGGHGRASCTHDPQRGELVVEPAAEAPEDCDLCLLLRSDRNWHGVGTAFPPARGWPLVAMTANALVAVPRPGTASAFLARAPPDCMG